MWVPLSLAAVKSNHHIPAYLLGRKKIPQSLPDYYSPGAETEAVFYLKENLKAWEATPGALDYSSTAEEDWYFVSPYKHWRCSLEI